ncbi:MAG: type II toxin-antitoxin system VapC family toxin [Acidobacteriota bacterium]|nr:type II toxin-antitoxin system VapC family toxin [Acidobacteriota bacterium]
MKNSSVVFDTSVLISYPNIFEPGWFSSVVLQELLVGASGKSDLQKWEAIAKKYERENRLLTPNAEAWRMAGRILNNILNDASRAQPGRRRPKLSNEKKQSIIRDVLIAVSAKQSGAVVISDNEDFPLISNYYEFRWVEASAFFA